MAWLVTQSFRTAVSGLLRITWRTVGSIVTRVMADIDAQVDRLANLRCIGIDEVSCAPRGAVTPSGLRDPPVAVAAAARS